MNLQRINLNLLKAFDILLIELNVTRAAEKLHITQAAMSNTLRQLRDLFDDRLLIRQAKGMTPTAKALEIVPKVKRALAYLEDVFEDDVFDPTQAERSFSLTVSSFCEHSLLPRLMVDITRHAPNIRLNISNLCSYDIADANLKSDVDLAIGEFKTPCGPDYHEVLIASDNGTCVMSHQHPLATKKLTLKKYLQQKHVSINLESKKTASLTDIILQKQNQSRQVVCMFTQLMPALLLMQQEPNLIGTFPKMLCSQLGDLNQHPFVFKPIPFEMPRCEYKMRWHKRTENANAHRWLREQIIKIGQIISIFE